MSRSPPRRGARRSRDDGGVDGARLVGSAAVGVATFVLGFVLTYVLKSGSIESQRFGDGVGTERLVSWVFYKMHNVGHQVRAMSGTRSQSESFDPSTWPMWEDWLFAVPPALLLGGGLLVGLLWADGDLKTGVTYGAALTVGYLPLAGLGGFLAQYTESSAGFGTSVSVTAGPKLVEALLLAGGAYPLVFGVVGGAVAAGVTGSSGAGSRTQPNAPPGGQQPRQGRPQQRQQGQHQQGQQGRQQRQQGQQGRQQRQQGQRRQGQRRQGQQGQGQGQGRGGRQRQPNDDSQGSNRRQRGDDRDDRRER